MMNTGAPHEAGNCAELQSREDMLHLLLVPLQAESHVNSLLRLAQALTAAEKGSVLVTFAYPARFHSLALKRNKLPCLLTASSGSSYFAQSNSMLRIEVVDDGLPLDEEYTPTPMDFRPFIVFQNAVQILVDKLVHSTKPSSGAPDLPPLRCIISDMFASWTQDMAEAAGLPRVDFCASTAAAYSMCSQLSVLISNGTLPLPKGCWLDSAKWTVDAPLIEGIPGLPPFPATELPSELVQAEEAMSGYLLEYYLLMHARSSKAHTILVHSIYELESQVFDALQATGLPIYAVGPLPPLPDLVTPTESGAARSVHECIHWLNKQPASSVVYVAVGSTGTFNSTEMQALALGLEASGHRFLWVIRRDSIPAGNLATVLPEGFLERTVDKGVGMIISWSPQAEVLGHPAVGAFLSHCGWSSTLESMWEGVPMVACPRGADQRSNARWIVKEWKMGVELERQVDGSFTKEAVERAVKDVLQADHSEPGGEAKAKACKETALHVKEVARSAAQKDGTSHSNLVHLLQRLRESMQPRV